AGVNVTAGSAATMYTPDGQSAADWAFNNGATSLTISFSSYVSGTTYNGTSAWPLFFDAAVSSLGVPVAVVARNAGSGSGTIGFPGDAFNCVTCGAFDDNNTTSHSDDVIYSLSGRGPLSDGRQKPDLCGPGVAVLSTAYDWE